MHKVKKLQSWQGVWLWKNYTLRPCRARSVSLPGMSLVYHHITVVEIVDVASAHRCSGLDQRVKGNSTGCLVKVDFFAINDVRQLSLLVFVPGVVGFNFFVLVDANSIELFPA